MTMHRTFARFKTLAGRSDGATAIEYSLIAGLISVVIIAAVALLGTNLSAYFHGVAASVSTAMPAS